MRKGPRGVAYVDSLFKKSIKRKSTKRKSTKRKSTKRIKTPASVSKTPYFFKDKDGTFKPIYAHKYMKNFEHSGRKSYFLNKKGKSPNSGTFYGKFYSKSEIMKLKSKKSSSKKKSRKQSVKRSSKKKSKKQSVKRKSVKRSSKKKSHKKKSSNKNDSCRKSLSEKIRTNIREMNEKGTFKSRSQAIAVAYSQVGKSRPGCKGIFTKSRNK